MQRREYFSRAKHEAAKICVRFFESEDLLAFQKQAMNARFREAKPKPMTPHDALAATGNGMCQKAPGRPLSAMKIETRKNPAVAEPTPSQYVNPKDKNELPLIIYMPQNAKESVKLDEELLRTSPTLETFVTAEIQKL